MRPLQSETPSPLEREPALRPLTGLFLPGRPCPCSETGLALEGECALVGLGCGQVQHLRCVRPLPALPLPAPSLTLASEAASASRLPVFVITDHFDGSSLWLQVGNKPVLSASRISLRIPAV